MKILFSENKNETLDFFLSKENLLINEDIDDIIEVLDLISKYWLSNNFKLKNIINEHSLGFIIPWLNKNNSKKLLNMNFKNYKQLNNPKLVNNNIDNIIARPLGTALHWLAGNVPVISLISLFQGILTKNKNIIKVSKIYQEIIPKIFFDLKKNCKLKNRYKKTFKKLISSILIIYVDHKEDRSLQKLSKSVDLRIIWGGKDAVTKILSLQKKINCKDIVFGPKISMAYVSKNGINNKSDLSDFAAKFTRDVFSFDQLGCNSPHNLFIQNGGKFNLKIIAEEIAIHFKKNISNKSNSDPVNKYNTLTKKFLHTAKLSNKVISSENHEWNIFLNKKTVIEDPLYNRSVFISPIKTINDLSDILPKNVQSFGLYVKNNEKYEIINVLADLGIDRFPEMGHMSFYTNPWDGYLPMQNMIRWISY